MTRSVNMKLFEKFTSPYMHIVSTANASIVDSKCILIVFFTNSQKRVVSNGLKFVKPLNIIAAAFHINSGEKTQI